MSSITLLGQESNHLIVLDQLESFDRRQSSDSLINYIKKEGRTIFDSKNDSIVGEAYRYQANALTSLERFQEAIKNYHISVSRFNRFFQGEKKYRLNTLYYNLAINKYHLSAYDSFEYYSKLALEPPGNVEAIQNRVALSQSLVYTEKKEYTKAIQLNTGRLAEIRENATTEFWEIAEAKMALAGSYFNGGYYDKAAVYYQATINSYEKNEELFLTDEINLGNSYGLLAQTFEINKDFKSANSEYAKAVKLFDRIYPEDQIEKIHLQNNIAILKREENRLHEAIEILKKLVNRSHDIGNRSLLKHIYANLSKNYASQQRFDLSKISLDSARYYLESPLLHSSFQDNYYFIEIQSFNLLQKVNANTINDSEFKHELKLIQNELNELTVDKTQFLSNSESQIAIQQQIKPVFENLLAAILSFNKKNDPSLNGIAIDIIDQSKSFVLENRILRKSRTDSDPDLIQKMRSLENKIQNNQELIHLDKTINQDSLSHIIVDQISSLDQLNSTFSQSVSKRLTSVNNTEKVSKDMLTLNYFLGDSSIYLSVLGQDYQELFCIGNTDSITITVHSFLKELSHRKPMNYNPTKDLIPFDIPKSIKRLLIIPDGILANVPFEALELSNKYLLEDYIISYDHSYHYHLINQDRKASKNTEIHGFAPAFGKDVTIQTRKEITLPTLNYNILEIQQILGLGVDIKNHIEYKATREKFLEVMDKAYILHLSTHGILDDSLNNYSFLAFAQSEKDAIEDQKSILYLDELYSKNIEAEMVVLSACNTGIGEIKNGEGVMSLGRGFSYAGARSIITSLWEVNDQSSSELMLSFYKYLQEGSSKDEALRSAKLTYLQHNFGIDRHPYYWSSFIAIGDMRPIQLEVNVWKFIGPIIAMLIIFLFFRKRMFNDGGF